LVRNSGARSAPTEIAGFAVADLIAHAAGMPHRGRATPIAVSGHDGQAFRFGQFARTTFGRLDAFVL